MRIRYLFRDTFRLFCRHWGLSLLTLATISAIYFLVGASALLTLNTRKIVYNMQRGLVVHAYAKTESAAGQIIELLKSNGDIEELRYTSPQEGLEILRQKMGARSKAADLVGENPLPWSIAIKLRRASAVAPLVKQLTATPQVDDLIYSDKLAERLIGLSDLISRASVTILVIALLVSGLVFYNTVRIGIDSKRQEISVMLLVGATRSYVSSPFILHGMLLGFFGVLGAAVLLYFGHASVLDKVDAILPFLKQQLDLREIAILGAVLLSSGMVTGWLCSFVTVRRYVTKALTPI